MIKRALADSGHGLHQAIAVGVHEGLVTLKGDVPSYYLKQMAQTAAMKCQNVEMLQNDIKVMPARLPEMSVDLSGKAIP